MNDHHPQTTDAPPQPRPLPLEPLPLPLDEGIPIACTPGVFAKEDWPAHIERSLDAIVRWPTRRRELADGFLFEYEGGQDGFEDRFEDRFAALARWAAAEHRCCPWAAFSVEMGPFAAGRPGTIRVRVRGTAAGKAFLATAYEYLQKLGGGALPDALVTSGSIARASLQRELDKCAR